MLEEDVAANLLLDYSYSQVMVFDSYKLYCLVIALMVTLGYYIALVLTRRMIVINQLQQTFDDAESSNWLPFGDMAGVCYVPLAEPVPEGSIHRARLVQGTKIPPHTHPANEYVLVVSGIVETGGRRCEAGTFWITPANTRQGPHMAITDVEILTVRLGSSGAFEE